MKIILNTQYNWETKQKGQMIVHSIGNTRAFEPVCDYLDSVDHPDRSRIAELLSEQVGNFAAIIEGRGYVLAFVDTIRSYPLFYTQGSADPVVSNSARTAKSDCMLDAISELSLLEFNMSGYVTGGETIYKDLYQLQAGEMLFWDRAGSRLERKRYYRYYPREIERKNEAEYIDELTAVIDRIFQRVIDNADGAPIWVPLSGGLDSRLIVCKLKEFGCNNLFTFSYGPPGNYEAKIAKRVASRLGVPWVFMPSLSSKARDFFRSGVRKDFWDFSDGLCAVPNMQDLEPLLSLREQGRLPGDAVMVNGQSGDFITGGHVPESLLHEGADEPRLFDAVIAKHFSLWEHLKTETYLDRIQGKIGKLLNEACEGDVSGSVPELYEYWEWQERQCKYVVHGQRVYDYMNLSWQLPLWDYEYMRFWQTVPMQYKSKQKLYRAFLEKYDYKGLFRNFHPVVWRWPGSSIAVVPVARFAQVLFGKACKERIYQYAKYFGHYSNQYAAYGYKHYLRHIHNARNIVSFYVMTWQSENGISNGLQ
ncbi:asparagine synthase-related protein [Elusimicrobiota bacterium]